MSPALQRLTDYLCHILEAIVRIHGYFKIDMEIVWKTIQKDLPDLYAQVHKVLLPLQQDTL